jgi:hypothetical protein
VIRRGYCQRSAKPPPVAAHLKGALGEFTVLQPLRPCGAMCTLMNLEKTFLDEREGALLVACGTLEQFWAALIFVPATKLPSEGPSPERAALWSSAVLAAVVFISCRQQSGTDTKGQCTFQKLETWHPALRSCALRNCSKAGQRAVRCRDSSCAEYAGLHATGAAGAR